MHYKRKLPKNIFYNLIGLNLFVRVTFSIYTYILCLWQALWMKIKPKKRYPNFDRMNIVFVKKFQFVCLKNTKKRKMLRKENFEETNCHKIRAGYQYAGSNGHSVRRLKLLFCVELNSFRVGGTVCQLLWINVTGWDCLRNQVSLGRNVRARHSVKAQTFHTLISYNRSNCRWLEIPKELYCRVCMCIRSIL